MNFKIGFIFLALASSVGCRGINRLIDGSEGTPPPQPQVITSEEPLGETPDFGIPTPAGMTRVVFHGLTPGNGIVAIQNAPGSTVRVFIKVRGGVQTWFVVSARFSEAYWFEVKGATIQIHGNLGNTEFCVYQYVPEVQP